MHHPLIVRRKISTTAIATMLIAVLLVSLYAFARQAYADPIGQITRGSTTTIHGNGALAEGSDGALYFASFRGHITKSTKSGTTTDISLSNVYPHYVEDIVRGTDGSIWYVAPTKIGKITNSGTHLVSSSPPAGMAFTALTIGPDGNIWASAYSGSGGAIINVYNASGTLVKSYPGGNITYSMSTNRTDGNVWYLQGGNDGTTSPNNNETFAVKITPDGTRTKYSLATTGIMADIAYGPDGNTWFAIRQNTYGTVGKIDASGNITTYNSNDLNWVASIATGPDGNIWATSNGKVTRVSTSGTVTAYSPISSPADIAAGNDGNMWFQETGNNKLSRIGTGITSTSTVDTDNDGLYATQEQSQGTSDFVSDTDKDGLTDYMESIYYSNRDTLFCNGSVTYCEYPNPLQRDLYVEIDWMTRPGAGWSTKPASTQLDSLKAAYLNKGIKAHFDTGQLGGGNEAPYTQSIEFSDISNGVDIYDYKSGGNNINPQFNYARYQVWRYMLMADQITYESNSAIDGVAYPGDDDSLIAYGKIKDERPLFFDNFSEYLSSTMIHELGHNLCLTDVPANNQPWYTGQAAECRYSGIDNLGSATYESAMSSRFSELVDYSDGTNQNDHDDWSALKLQDFTGQHVGDPSYRADAYSKKKVKKVKIKAAVTPGIKSKSNL